MKSNEPEMDTNQWYYPVIIVAVIVFTVVEIWRIDDYLPDGFLASLPGPILIFLIIVIMFTNLAISGFVTDCVEKWWHSRRR